MYDNIAPVAHFSSLEINLKNYDQKRILCYTCICYTYFCKILDLLTL